MVEVKCCLFTLGDFTFALVFCWDERLMLRLTSFAKCKLIGYPQALAVNFAVFVRLFLD